MLTSDSSSLAALAGLEGSLSGLGDRSVVMRPFESASSSAADLRVGALERDAIPCATVPSMHTAEARHAAPVSCKLGWGLPMLNAKTCMLSSCEYMEVFEGSTGGAGETKASFGVPRTLAAASVLGARPIMTAPAQRMDSICSRYPAVSLAHVCR